MTDSNAPTESARVERGRDSVYVIVRVGQREHTWRVRDVIRETTRQVEVTLGDPRATHRLFVPHDGFAAGAGGLLGETLGTVSKRQRNARPRARDGRAFALPPQRERELDSTVSHATVDPMLLAQRAESMPAAMPWDDARDQRLPATPAFEGMLKRAVERHNDK